uniref:Uncharacterized protein n=1 Tax=uncultured bacterium contig00107 TaxID=1181573 RepID=A0A806K2U9_9BACT|nr:hypothetical protein [uncultured bacterium contig00107]
MHDAVDVVLDEAVHHVGGHEVLVRVSGDQIVERLDLAGVELAIDDGVGAGRDDGGAGVGGVAACWWGRCVVARGLHGVGGGAACEQGDHKGRAEQ